jgi:hypothetical protein
LNNGVANSRAICAAIRDVSSNGEQQQPFYYFQQMPGESTFNLTEQQQQEIIVASERSMSSGAATVLQCDVTTLSAFIAQNNIRWVSFSVRSIFA